MKGNFKDINQISYNLYTLRKTFGNSEIQIIVDHILEGVNNKRLRRFTSKELGLPPPKGVKK